MYVHDDEVHTILPRGRNLRHVEVASAYEVVSIHFVPVQKNMAGGESVECRKTTQGESVECRKTV